MSRIEVEENGFLEIVYTAEANGRAGAQQTARVDLFALCGQLQEVRHRHETARNEAGEEFRATDEYWQDIRGVLIGWGLPDMSVGAMEKIRRGVFDCAEAFQKKEGWLPKKESTSAPPESPPSTG